MRYRKRRPYDGTDKAGQPVGPWIEGVDTTCHPVDGSSYPAIRLSDGDTDIAENLVAEDGVSLHLKSDAALLEYLGVTGCVSIMDLKVGSNLQAMAAIELVNRMDHMRWRPGIAMDSTALIARHYKRLLQNKPQEIFIVASLDSRHKLLQDTIVGMGGLTQCLVDPKVIYRWAIEQGAASIVVVHNHPSGDSTPSADDVLLTKRIEAAGEVMGCPLMDHIIVAMGGCYSFAEHGLVNREE